MATSSFSSGLFAAPAPPRLPRAYRLVNELGEPHPILDDLYESHEAAWTEALHWWQTQAHPTQSPIAIGVEVSTSNGEWRTIRHPCS